MDAEQIRHQLMQVNETIKAIEWWFSSKRDSATPNDIILGCIIQRHAYCLVFNKSPATLSNAVPVGMTELLEKLEHKVKSLEFINELDEHLIQDKEK